MDIMTPLERSALMRRIRGKNTKTELLVRRLLHRLEFHPDFDHADRGNLAPVVLHKPAPIQLAEPLYGGTFPRLACGPDSCIIVVHVFPPLSVFELASISALPARNRLWIAAETFSMPQS